MEENYSGVDRAPSILDNCFQELARLDETIESAAKKLQPLIVLRPENPLDEVSASKNQLHEIENRIRSASQRLDRILRDVEL